MPATVDKGQPVSESINTKLMQEAGLSTSTVNTWITGGPIGSKTAVLVFKPTALARHMPDDDDAAAAATTPPDKCRFPPVADAKPMFSIAAGHRTGVAAKKLALLDYDVHRKRFVKPNAADSLSSSSENSISSACDDPTDLEADIVQAEKRSTADAKKMSIGDRSAGNKENVEQECAGGSEEGTPDSGGGGGHGDASMEPTVDEMPASLLNITYKFTNTETKLLKRILASHGLKEAKENQNFSLLWTGLHMKPDILRALLPYQRVNHFPRSYELTRKDRLYKNIEKMQHLRGMKHFDIVPLSFMLPLEYRNLVQAHRSGHKGPWIVKPAASSRGRGIYLVNTPEQIPLDDQVIVSKYIADPLCIDGHKCDVRLYVVVTSFDPLLIYLYEEGLVRLATVKYDKTAENLWNPCMHLCNYSINKYHSDYIKASENDEDIGHKWTFSALLRHLKSQGSDTASLMQAIEDVIIKSILSCSQSIVSACRMFVPNSSNCFELYGFDILIDNTLKPWLLEVNLSPSLGIDTHLDAKVKSSMLADLLTLVGIPALTPLSRGATDFKGSRFRSAVATSQTFPRRHNESSLAAAAASKRMLSSLSSEESRVLKGVRAQYGRRGGFVRVFPQPDSMSRFGMFLDPLTGIPMSIQNSTSMTPGSSAHNFNQMLHAQLYGPAAKVGATAATAAEWAGIDERMGQYERTLHHVNVDLIVRDQPPKCLDEARRLRKQLRKSMESGNELTLLQARKIFALFLESVLKRLSQEPKNQHERQILKFITRSDLSIKTPSFMKNPYSSRIHGKDRSAIVAKLLGDYLEAFHRDTESCVDNYSYYGLIPSQLYEDFVAQAQESDLESILALHVNLTQNLSFLYNRCTTQANIPSAPPIPTGANGFLKALPSMAPNIASRDLARIDSYYKSLCPVDLERDVSVDRLDKMAAGRSSNPALFPAKKRSSVA